jgi:hypothetical protein
MPAIASRIRGVSHEVTVLSPMQSGAVRKFSTGMFRNAVVGGRSGGVPGQSAPLGVVGIIVRHDAAFGC